MKTEIAKKESQELALTEIRSKLLSVKSSELTISEAHKNGTQVVVARKDKKLWTRLLLSLLDVCASIDASKGLDEESAEETLEMLLRDFYYLKYEEFLLVFRMMKEGRLPDGGKIFERLKAPEFRRAFEEYDTMEERSMMWERREYLQKQNSILTLPEIPDEWVSKLAKDTKPTEEEEYQKIREQYKNKEI